MILLIISIIPNPFILNLLLIFKTIPIQFSSMFEIVLFIFTFIIRFVTFIYVIVVCLKYFFKLASYIVWDIVLNYVAEANIDIIPVIVNFYCCFCVVLGYVNHYLRHIHLRPLSHFIII